MSKVTSVSSILFACLFTAMTWQTRAEHVAEPDVVTVVGDFQEELGCSSDWQPECGETQLQFDPHDGVWRGSFDMPAGDYEAKVTHDESWDVNFGQGGVPDGSNIAFTVPGSGNDSGTEMFFFYDPDTHILIVSQDDTPEPTLPEPDSVTIAGSLQAALGCSADWQADCLDTALLFDAEDSVWQARFALTAGDWEYKAALDGTWDVNFGADATADGPNIGLSLEEAASVKFYYSHRTNWVTDDHSSTIATAVGNFQSLIGCDSDWDPTCLRSWLQDPDGDGIHTLRTRLPAGDYEVKVAHDESWDVNFGQGGVPDGSNIAFSVPDGGGAFGTEVFFFYDASSHVLTVSLQDLAGDLSLSRAHWVDASTIAWNPVSLPDDGEVRLHHDPAAQLALEPGGISQGQSIVLQEDPNGLAVDVRERFPHLADFRAFRLPELDADAVASMLKGQLAVSANNAEGSLVDATSLQIPGVIDELYYFDGQLGVIHGDDGISLRLWAPTAQSVRLLLFEGSSPSLSPAESIPMTEDPDTGVWQVDGPLSWDRRYYLYEVTVYAPATRQIETNRVTDPYSLSLAANSTRSQIVNLDDADLKPAGWDLLEKPVLDAPEDVVVYELHVRDFSIVDDTISASDRGKFTAFTHADSIAMQHLRSLAQSGLSHVHLLPAFDFANVPERDEDQLEPQDDLSAYPPDSDQQQAAIEAIKDQDGFNWGYDPLHYTVPDGSYASDPDGVARVREFRQMVQAMNEAGLRVVMDVVYNHTNAAGQNPNAVLDRIVPGYYHRLNLDGFVEMSSCCPNTASEHRMMEKLMIDSVLTWASDYRVDGFRFDLMGHHMKSNMVALREALDELSLPEHGVDGPGVYVYGESWNFGEVANNARGVNAIQRNMAGTGIGSFNDRLRDGVRGGSAFADVREQGFVSGLYYDPNGLPQGDELGALLHHSDWVRIGLAGTLADFEFINAAGERVRADQLDYYGQQAGYTSDPQEIINYAAAHDNETLFDAVQLKAGASTSLDERIRMQWMGSAIVTLSQGIPFIHAGQEILRSKSMDRDSFNSSDWFNEIDYSLESNNWGRGLPPAEKNSSEWPIMQPLLADPALKPAPMKLAATVAQFEEMLQIRRSSPLFRLREAEQIHSRLAFLNTGPDQIPGLIVMRLSDAEGEIDRRHSLSVTLFNALKEPVHFPLLDWQGEALALHPVQRQSSDPIVRQAAFDPEAEEVFVPAQTTAVFVVLRPAEQRIELLIGDIRRLFEQGQIRRRQAISMTFTLRIALGQLRNNNNRIAAAMLRIFMRKVEIFGLDDALRREAEDIKRQLQMN